MTIQPPWSAAEARPLGSSGATRRRREAHLGRGWARVRVRFRGKVRARVRFRVRARVSGRARARPV